MTSTVNLWPFVVRVQDGREHHGYFRDAAHAADSVVAYYEAPVVLVIRADEPFVRPKRGWLSKLLFGGA